MAFGKPMHPGQILEEELEELGVTPTELARQIKVPANRISQIVNGKRSITGDTALRLGRWFNMNPRFWLNLQQEYELMLAEESVGSEIRSIQPRVDWPALR